MTFPPVDLQEDMPNIWRRTEYPSTSKAWYVIYKWYNPYPCGIIGIIPTFEVYALPPQSKGPSNYNASRKT